VPGDDREVKFTVVAREQRARAGELLTDHGTVLTPAFMPVGTQGAVKAIGVRELEELGARIILGNTYHLYLRPGAEIVAGAGGIQKFTGWKKPILTDSGGYQIFSLADLRKITEEGARFRSHLDGSEHLFTPESVMEIQRKLGSDIMMVLDECPPFPCEFEYAKTSHELTVRWATRCKEYLERSKPVHSWTQAVFGIIQGATYPELREQSAAALTELDFDGYALGGLAVGETAETMYSILEATEKFLPETKPRYLMGVGTPENLLESVERGMDMFDCVMPTRNARNAMLFTRDGPLNIRNTAFREDGGPVDAECQCYTCRTHSRAYVRHLVQSKEVLALQLATIHNLAFYHWLMDGARKAIVEQRFKNWKHSVIARMRREKQG